MTIPTRDKNILLLPVTDGGVTQAFNMPGQPGYDSSKAKHNGLDLGWTDNPYCNVLAAQDGKVVQIIKNDVSGSRGNGIVLQHDYADGTHRWTGYIHLKNEIKGFKVGDFVKQGTAIGVRGGSPYINGKQKYGTHLHLYVTNAVKTAYTWSALLNNVTNPRPFLYKSKKVTYKTLAKSFDASLKFMEDVMPDVVAPVVRNPLENQLMEKTGTLRVRLAPSLSGTIIGYLQKDKYYDWFDFSSADGYTWYKIKDGEVSQWCAQTGTMTIFPKKTEVEILKEEIEKLNGELKTTKSELETSIKENKELVDEVKARDGVIKEVEQKNNDLQEKNKSLENTNVALQSKITEAANILTL